MFGFFNKERLCAVCRASSHERMVVGVDLSSRGEIPGNPGHQYLCREHAQQVLATHLSSFKGGAVCIEPLKGFNAYGYIIFERAREWAIEKDQAERAKHLLPAGEACLHCEENAHYAYCDQKVYYKNILTLKNPHQLKAVINPIFYCSAHFVEALLQHFETHGSKIREITPPYGNEGIYLSGEC